jgi:hypothetical protein
MHFSVYDFLLAISLRVGHWVSLLCETLRERLLCETLRVSGAFALGKRSGQVGIGHWVKIILPLFPMSHLAKPLLKITRIVDGVNLKSKI